MAALRNAGVETVQTVKRALTNETSVGNRYFAHGEGLFSEVQGSQATKMLLPEM